MRIGKALFLSAFLWTAATVMPVHAQQPCGLVRVASYDMMDTTQGHVAIPFIIDGKSEFLIVDTGGFMSLLQPSIAEEENMPRQKNGLRVIGVAGQMMDEIATASSVTVGPLNVPNVDFMLTLPGETFGFVEGDTDKPVVGILAPNVLSRFDVDFDFANHRLNLFDSNVCPGKVVYWTTSPAAELQFRIDTNGHITIPIALDGQDMEATLDTGAPLTVIRDSIAYRLFNLAPGSPGIDEHIGHRADGTAVTAYTHLFASLSVGGIAVSNVTVELLADKMGRRFQREEGSTDDPDARLPALLFGLRELRNLHLYISYKEKTIYATAADAH